MKIKIEIAMEIGMELKMKIESQISDMSDSDIREKSGHFTFNNVGPSILQEYNFPEKILTIDIFLFSLVMPQTTNAML